MYKRQEGLCLKCARELGIKPVDDIIKRMGISDEDLENLTSEMMSAFEMCIRDRWCWTVWIWLLRRAPL